MSMPTQPASQNSRPQASVNGYMPMNAKNEMQKKTGNLRNPKADFADAMRTHQQEGHAQKPLSNTPNAETRLVKNFDSMLKFLLASIKNQSPLDPMSTQEFTQGLVQFAGIEQALQTNKHLGDMKALMDKNQVLANLQLVDRQVNLVSNSLDWNGDPIEVTVAPTDENAKKSTLSIVAANGVVVRTFDLNSSIGTQKIVWDGMDSKNSALPHGSYKIMALSFDEKNTSTPLETSVLTRIDGIDFTTEVPSLVAGSVKEPVTSVQQIYAKKAVDLKADKRPATVATRVEVPSDAKPVSNGVQMPRQESFDSPEVEGVASNVNATDKIVLS